MEKNSALNINRMGKLKSSFVLKKYSTSEKLVELSLNFGYKEFDPVKDKFSYKPLRWFTHRID